MSRAATSLWLLVGLVVVGTALFVRLDGLGEPSLWYDEVLHFNLAQEALDQPLSAWITGRIGDRENGPLYYATQLVALSLASGELAVRLMPALMGTAAVVVMMGLGLAVRRGPMVALPAAILLATSPLHVYFSREGRPYVAIMLMASLLLLLLLLRDRKWAVPLAYLFSVATASFGTAGVPVLVSFGILSLLDWAVWQRSRSSPTLHFAIAALIGGALLIAPTIERFEAAKPNPKMTVTHPLSLEAADRLLASFTVSGVDWASSRPSSLVWVGLACCGTLFLSRRAPRRALHITGMFILPVVCWLALLLSFDRWYVVRYTSAGLPAFILLVAVGLVSLIEGVWRSLVGATVQTQYSRIPLVVVFSLTAALSTANWRAVRTEPWQKPDWRRLTNLINQLTVDSEPVIAQNKLSATCIRYYLDRFGYQIEVLSVKNKLDRATQMAEKYQRAWVLSSGYLLAEDFRSWTTTLDPVFRSQFSNLDLYYYPSLGALLEAPERAAALALVLESEGDPGDRHEFGTSELLLGTGWSFPETSADGTGFRWAAAETAEIGFLVETSQDSNLRLRLLPFPATTQPPQTVEIHLNSHIVGRLHLRPGWNEYTVPIPAEYWDVGTNLVALRFGWLQSPADLNPESTDSRMLAAAFDSVELMSSGAAPAP